jgi:hypothetical protein
MFLLLVKNENKFTEFVRNIGGRIKGIDGGVWS